MLLVALWAASPALAAAPDDAPRSSSVALGLTGVGAAALIGGGVLLGLQAASTTRLQRDLYANQVSLNLALARKETILTERRAGSVLVVGGAAIAAMGLTWYFIAKPKAVPAVTVLPTTDGAAVNWSASW